MKFEDRTVRGGDRIIVQGSIENNNKLIKECSKRI